jgi:hypothetical protein
MSIKWPITDLTGSSVLKAEHINDGSDALQNFVNEGIGTDELKSPVEFLGGLDTTPYDQKGWLESRQVYRPEFYGSPSPRMMATSGQTHFREVQNDWSSGVVFNTELTGAGPVAVPDTATRIKLKHKATVNIMASFYMFEVGGVALAASEVPLDDQAHNFAWGEGGVGTTGELDADEKKQLHRGYESLRAGNCNLSINGAIIPSTKRRIYTSTVGPKSCFSSIEVPGPGMYSLTPEAESKRVLYQQRGFLFFPMIGRHQHNILLQTTLEPGVHDLGLVFTGKVISKYPGPDYGLLDFFWANKYGADRYDRGSVDERPAFPKIKNIFFLARNFIVDCYYEDNV